METVSKDHKVTIRTNDGEEVTTKVTAEDARALEDLPFTSSNVTSTTVTPPEGGGGPS
jgi:hypothetical protein